MPDLRHRINEASKEYKGQCGWNPQLVRHAAIDARLRVGACCSRRYAAQPYSIEMIRMAGTGVA
jgi:hypothetical protein